ncbi:hypothetical protein [Actinocrinis puniceicyclus]|uniref:hypothetical protein n=1 Tax=Actinocrinis puniceicyclus TaxID=977794 RepID=UPI001FE398E4|nr:hypothetical protein [Actinocrinis puniceicyclus]
MTGGRKNILLRLDAAVHDALVRWAGDELRSTTAQIELLLRRALADAGRLPHDVGDLPRRGRPPRNATEPARPGAEQPGGAGDRSDPVTAVDVGGAVDPPPLK